MEGGSGGVNRVVEGSKYSRLWSLGEFAVHDPFKESRKLKEWYARKTRMRRPIPTPSLSTSVNSISASSSRTSSSPGEKGKGGRGMVLLSMSTVW